MRFAAAAFAASAIFLAGVLVGIGSGDDGADEAPVAIALVDEGAPSPQSSEGKGSMGDEDVPRQVPHGEAGDEGDGGNAWYEDEDEGADDDNSGPGSDDSGSGSDNSGPGSDNSGPGSSDSGSDSDNSGSGSDDSGSGSDSSGSGSSGSGGGGSSGSG
jgi:hypothetical protein